MIKSILKFFFNYKNKKILKKYYERVHQINLLENKIALLNDTDLAKKTLEFKDRLNNNETLDDILYEAFSVVREASKRTLNLRHYDVQLIGGMVLHEGKIAEMKTGEGKTLVSTLPAYLNCLSGKGVHIVTVNDYLTKRDAEWMKPIYDLLEISIGVIQSNDSKNKRKEAYLADITYATNNELGFDYLRDNMILKYEDKVQRNFNFSIIDEVDSILIDEARTPLIISGNSYDSNHLYRQIDSLIKKLTPAKKNEEDKWIEESGDYKHELKEDSILLTEKGISNIEKNLNISNLYTPKNVHILHNITQCLKANISYKKNVDYIVENNKVIIIDEHTGRKMEGRRYSDGLHQAIEAKEGVSIAQETQTLASITFQNYFKMYKKLSGMTGTAETEAEEFYKIYKLSIQVIPTNMPMIRKDFSDQIYKTEREKFIAIISEIENLHKQGRPILVGTISIQKSEEISKLLKKKLIKHNILNAKYHEKEAKIISQAGKKYSVTIATNMAGRGTDIKLEDGIAELGGLHIIGTERHESRRIDNQLRGRSGRQGDNGSSRFYLSLEDNLMKMFGSGKISKFMEKIGFSEGEKIEHPWISKAISNAQKRVETQHFEFRKYLLEYDNIMNIHRSFIYNLRNQLLSKENLKEKIKEFLLFLINDYIFGVVEKLNVIHINNQKKIFHQIHYNLSINIEENFTPLKDFMDKKKFKDSIFQILIEHYEKKLYLIENNLEGIDQKNILNHIIYPTLIQIIDVKWQEHLYNLDHLKEGIHLQSYADKNPLVEYKIESFHLFENLKFHIFQDILKFLFKFELNITIENETSNSPNLDNVKYIHKSNPEYIFSQGNKISKNHTGIKKMKIGRNEPCICNSNKKYKKCCGNIKTNIV